jgi:deazaflavin-dependent oxidoreductase (nitroreductase family)
VSEYHHDDDRPARDDASLLHAVPGLARIATGTALRTAAWSIGAYARAGSRVLGAAASGESAADLLRETGDEIRAFAREVLRVENGARDPEQQHERHGEDAPSDDSLRERAAELLRLSADVRYEEHAHPAYERILEELAPDEGRILRLLMRDGPQPAVDVRSSRTLHVSSQLVAPGLSMIGAHAGARYIDRVPAYLNNLFRLGLIWFSREPLEDPVRYQVLEAQPDVLDALRSGGRGRTVRRSILLTPFGENFCVVCMPDEHAAPGASRGRARDVPAAGEVPVAGEAPAAGEPPTREEGQLGSSAVGPSDDDLFGPEHVRVYRETKGERGYIWRGAPILLLNTKGRSSGETRTMPLIHRTDGDRWVVVASKGGWSEHPHWYQNLEADPDVTIEVKGEEIPVHAQDAAGEERERLWSLMTEVWPAYDEYQARTDREIPVVILSRR